MYAEALRTRHSGQQQHQGAIRQLTNAIEGDHERGDGCPRVTYHDEQAGA
jgi:hypothetical protein